MAARREVAGNISEGRVRLGTLHEELPPAFLSLEDAAKKLGVSRQHLTRPVSSLRTPDGKAHALIELLDRWKPPGQKIMMIPLVDVAEIADWRRTRQGLIALGRLSPTSRAWPDSLLAARNFNSEDYHGGDCLLCDRAAVYDPLHEEAGTWCPEHGVVPPGDYPPTPRQAALMAEYEGQEWGDAP